jgi:hypothetical protein
MHSMHEYEIRPRSDKRGLDLISDACHLAACGTPGQTRSTMQSDTPNIGAAHIML